MLKKEILRRFIKERILLTSCSNGFTYREAFIVERVTWLSSRVWKISSVTLKQDEKVRFSMSHLMIHKNFKVGLDLIRNL